MKETDVPVPPGLSLNARGHSRFTKGCRCAGHADCRGADAEDLENIAGALGIHLREPS